ncbi:MAG: hypothetical protein V4722_13740 [Bacteroidota bacterium]
MNTIVTYIVPLLSMALLAFVLTRMRWLQRAGFTKKFVVFFFVAKCFAGFAYNWVALHYIPNRGDIWPFYEDGVYLYQTFLQSPSAFFDTLSQSFRYDDLNALSSDSSLARSAFEIIKLFHFLLNFLSFGSLAGNTVIFNFIAVLCFFYCWKFFREQLGSQGIIAGLIFFLLPSIFFYSSGILKEGLVICLLCLLIPLSHKLLAGRFSFKTLAKGLLALLLLFALKFFVAGLWVFATVVWGLMLAFPRRQWLVLLVSLGAAVLVFFYSHQLLPSLNFPEYLVQRQQEFLALPAASAMPVKVLEPEPLSFVKALPSALNNTLFKPLPGEGGKAMYLAFTAEMLLFWLGMIYIIWRRKKGSLSPNRSAFAAMALLFGLLNLLIIGLIVPNIGAMVRYRSIFFPFLALFLIIACNWQPRPGRVYSRLLLFIAGNNNLH